MPLNLLAIGKPLTVDLADGLKQAPAFQVFM